MRKLILIVLSTTALLIAQNPVTSPFPTSLDNDQTLSVEKNNVTSTLSAGINAITTSIPVATGTGARFLVGQIVTLGFNALGEKCQITVITGDTLTCNARTAQFGGAAPTTQALGTLVSQFHEAQTSNSYAAAIKAIETALGAGLSNVSGGGGGGSVGTNTQTTNYTALSGDSGKLIIMNGSSITLTLPATSPGVTWAVTVLNLNSTSLTISRNGRNINGGTSNVTLLQYGFTRIYTDATNYFLSVPLVAGTNVTLTPASNGVTVAASGGGGSSAFSAITSATNTTATMACGTGCLIGPTGTGGVVANVLQSGGSGGAAVPAFAVGALSYNGSTLAWTPSSNVGRLQVTTSGTTLTVTCSSGPCIVGPIGNPVSPTYASFSTGTYSCTALSQPSGTTADVFVSSSGTLSVNTDGIVPSSCSGITVASTGGLAAFPGGSWIARATATSSTWDVGGVTIKAGTTPGAPVYNFRGALVADGSGNVDYIGKVPVLTSTSGPVADPTGDYYFLVNNASGALTYNLPAGVTGMQRCYRNSTGKTGVITVAVTTSNVIDLAGVASTTSTGSITSGGALGDSVCLWSDATNHWMAQAGLGTWTAH